MDAALMPKAEAPLWPSPFPKSFEQVKALAPKQQLIIALLVVLVIVVIVMIYKHFFGKKKDAAAAKSKFGCGGAELGVPPGFLTSEPGIFSANWGVGQKAAMQASVSAGDPAFQWDCETVWQRAPMALPPPPTNLACPKGQWVGQSFVRDIDSGSSRPVYECYNQAGVVTGAKPMKDGMPNPFDAPVPAVAAKKDKFLGNYSPHDPAKPKSKFEGAPEYFEGAKEDFALAPSATKSCSEMWGYDAETELGTQLAMGAYEIYGGEGEDKFEREVHAMN